MHAVTVWHEHIASSMLPEQQILRQVVPEGMEHAAGSVQDVCHGISNTTFGIQSPSIHSMRLLNNLCPLTQTEH